MKRTVLIRADGSVFPGAIYEGPDELRQMQHIVGGYIEAVRHDHPNLTAFCDEDGWRKQLPRNTLATAIFGNEPHPDMAPQDIVGNVLVMGRTAEDGETHGLTVEQADIFLSPSGEDIINAVNQYGNEEMGLDYMEDRFGGELP